jgi:nucleoside-diphosphate-sugar epimerase
MVGVSRYLITGAGGFIGHALAERLRAAGHEVLGVDVRGDPAVGVVEGDISRPGAWQRTAEGMDAVIHAAALVGMPTDVSRFWTVNVVGTRRALEAARDAGARRFLHLSSVVTYGLDFPDGVEETWPVQPTGVAYVDTKIAAEQVVLQAHAAGEQEVTIVRPGDVYGPASVPWTLLPIELMRAGKFVLPARGRGIHSPVFVDDLVEGISRALEAPAAAGRVINLSGGVGVPTSEYFAPLAAAAGRRLRCLPTAPVLAGAELQHGWARLTRRPNELTPDGVRYLALRRGTYGIRTARELLDWDPEVELGEGMARTVSWLREHGIV